VAGTGAVAAYVGSTPSLAKEPAAMVAALPSTTTSAAPVTTEQTTPMKPAKKLSCEQQTWPYLENRCFAGNGNMPARKVRLVMAPRKGDAGLSSATPPNMVSRDGVLRGPDVAPEADKAAPSSAAKPDAPVVKKAMRRSDLRQPKGRNDFRRVYSVYSVPSGDSAKPVIVVRPLRLNAYSSRF
jgi:hypothetical protein